MYNVYLSLLKILYKALFSPCLVLQRLIFRQLRVLNLLKVFPIITGVAVVRVVDLVLLSFNFLEDNLQHFKSVVRTIPQLPPPQPHLPAPGDVPLLNPLSVRDGLVLPGALDQPGLGGHRSVSSRLQPHQVLQVLLVFDNDGNILQI